MKALILAGGLGTRLRSVVSDVPKPLADINGKPFLEYLLDSIDIFSFDEYIISVGYKAEIIEKMLGNSHNGVPISYIREDEPLGTGGAIKLALSKKVKADEYAFVFNGDTLLKVDIKEMHEFAQGTKSDLLLAAKYMENCNRYGTIDYEDNKINSFNAAGDSSSGYINGGIYIMKPSVLNTKEVGEKFSFEKEILEPYCRNHELLMFKTDGYFIDIGVPEDYERAKNELCRYIYE